MNLSISELFLAGILPVLLMVIAMTKGRLLDRLPGMNGWCQA